MKKPTSSYIHRRVSQTKFRYVRAIILAIGLGIVGTVFLLTSHAATNVVATEPETGTIAAPAAQVTDATASAGKAVKFGAVSSGGAITWGWQLTSSNAGLTGAGIDKNTLPVYSGNFVSGQTYSNVKITHTIDLSGVSNVTLNKVWIQPTGGGDAVILGNGDKIVDSDIDGSISPTNDSVVSGVKINNPAGNYTIQRVNIVGTGIGVWSETSGNNGLVDTVYVHNMRNPTGSSHVDGFTRRDGTGSLLIIRTRIDDSPVNGGATGPFFLTDTFGNAQNPTPIDNITLQDSMLEGDGYLIYTNNNGSGLGYGLNNVRLRHTGWGDITTLGNLTIHQWVNVYDYNAAAPMDANGGAKGAVVNSP